PVGVLLHYVAVLGVLALFLSFAVPDLMSQVTAALEAAKTHHVQGGEQGFRDKLLTALQARLGHLPSAGKLIHPAVSIGETAVAILVGIFFTFAAAAYWLFERDRAIDFVTSLLPRPRRKLVRDTWVLIDLKLGAFVRGQLILIGFVSAVVSLAF